MFEPHSADHVNVSIQSHLFPQRAATCANFGKVSISNTDTVT